MGEQGKIGQEKLSESAYFKTLETCSNFSVESYAEPANLEDTHYFKKLPLTPTQQMQISALVQHIPGVMATGTMAQAYIATFPQGLPHTLVALQQGGVGSMIQEGGKFVGSASFYSLAPQAAIMGAFTTMAIASGQYFLTQINSELRMIQLGVNEILSYLYGEKRAELLAEISFVKSAFQNYASLMSHEAQRVATIVNLQEARKIAIKDVEFYLEDLASTVSRGAEKKEEYEAMVDEAQNLRKSLDLSMQLYVMSNILEVHFSQNQDAEYLASLRKDMLNYVRKCDMRIVSHFSILKGKIEDYSHEKNFIKKAKETVNQPTRATSVRGLLDEVEAEIKALSSEEESPMKKIIQSSLTSPEDTEYYLRSDGTVYIKNK